MKHRQALVGWVVSHLCHARPFLSSCKNLFSFKGTRAQAAQPWQHYGSGCVTPAMPCLQSVLRWLMDPRDPSWPCYFYQWASCREPQGFCHTDTLTSPSQVSCCKCFPLKLQLLYLACPSTVVMSTFGVASVNEKLCALSCYHTTKQWNNRALPISITDLFYLVVLLLTLVITSLSTKYSQPLLSIMVLGSRTFIHWVSCLNSGHRTAWLDAVSAQHSMP